MTLPKVTMIIGEPAVGKSLLIRELMKLDEWRFKWVKWVPHHVCDERRAVILGIYEDRYIDTEAQRKFPGTARLSMAVQPRAQQWIFDATHERVPAKSILFEGDRLGNASMIRYLQSGHERDHWDFEVILLYLREEFLRKRRAEFRQSQSPVFWKSRQTKIRNLANTCISHNVRIRKYEHVNLSDTHNIIAHIRKDRI